MPIVKIERKTDYSLRPANPDDKEGIKSFYKQNIWKNKDAEMMYRWKYEKNPFGEISMCVGVDSLDMVISNAVFMPWRFYLNGTKISAVQAVDAVLKLEYRGQGLPLMQYNRGMNDAMGKGASLCFAFPNDTAATVHKKNNGLRLGCVLRYTKPLRTEYLVDRYIKSNIFSKIASSASNAILKLFSKETYLFNTQRLTVEKVKKCNSDFDDFWDRVAKKFHNKIMTNKNREYLNWKYLDSPNNDRHLYSVKKNGVIYGFVALETTPKIGYIIDILACDDMALTHLIAYSIKYFRRVGKDSVIFVALEDNIYFRHFETFGFVKRPEQKHFYVYLDEKVEDKDFFTDSKNWFITIGDCDIEGL